jgi:hypothetical protein
MIGNLWLKTYSFKLDRLTAIPSGPELVDRPAKKIFSVSMDGLGI